MIKNKANSALCIGEKVLPVNICKQMIEKRKISSHCIQPVDLGLPMVKRHIKYIKRGTLYRNKPLWDFCNCVLLCCLSCNIARIIILVNQLQIDFDHRLSAWPKRSQLQKSDAKSKIKREILVSRVKIHHQFDPWLGIQISATFTIPPNIQTFIVFPDSALCLQQIGRKIVVLWWNQYAKCNMQFE